MILEGVYALLTANAGFTDIAAARLYPEVAPQDVPYPMATFSLDGDQPDQLLDATRGSLRRALVSFDCYAATLLEAWNLAMAIEDALVVVHGTVGSFSPPIEVDNIQVERPHFSLFETDTKLYRLTAQFAVAYYR